MKNTARDLKLPWICNFFVALEQPCEPNEFRCANGRCAPKIWRCDKDDDCGDGSDEINCREFLEDAIWTQLISVKSIGFSCCVPFHFAATAAPGSICQADEYRCVSGDQCIPLSYQCDDQIDCQDRSDEIGCGEYPVCVSTSTIPHSYLVSDVLSLAPPTVIVPPPPEREIQQGGTLEVECEAIGVPTPLIVWRLNWGHIGQPPRVSTTSEHGRGKLTIRQASKEDEGAYTCEAINSKGSIFAQPDLILIVTGEREE